MGRFNSVVKAVSNMGRFNSVVKSVSNQVKTNELQRLMAMYGVTSPAVPAYAGALAPALPIEPTETSGAKRDAYNTDLTRFKIEEANSQKDQELYRKYVQDFRASINPANIYNQPQFGLRGSANKSPAPAAQPPAPQYSWFSKGGQVKTKFNDGGLNDLAEQYDIPNPVFAPSAMPNIIDELPAPAAPTVPAPVAPATPAQRGSDLTTLLGRYFPQGEDYGPELRSARQAMAQESDAFNKLLQQAVNQPQESGPSKAEMYFRLAAAFGAPTKTGNFMESVGKAGEAAAGISKEKREASSAEKARRLQLGLEAQKLRMTGAKEDLNTLRSLAAEGMKDKRAIATELIKDYVKSGQPESSAGKQAKDEGLVPGTPEFQKRVGQIAEMNIEKQMAQLNATLAGMSAAQANAALAQQKFGFQQEQAKKLTPKELDLKVATEDSLSTLKNSMGILDRAFNLNKNSMGGSLVDKGARMVLEAAGSKDPTLLNTQELENLLTDQMISSAAEKMKGVLSDSDIKLLQAVSGAKAKNQEERKRIMLNAYGALKRGYEKQQKRLNEIQSGLYRDTSVKELE